MERRRLPGAYLALARLAVSELRSDLAGLFTSDWADASRSRARRLAEALEDSCSRQGLAELAQIARSVAALTRIGRPEAIPLYAELRRKFKELLSLAELQLLQQARSVA
ncbi:MAG: hypothetical protein HY293_04525 [Planctomycetes bacterium]|nr:hypothetical protein [Planctomycetota bacterium]